MTAMLQTIPDARAAALFVSRADLHTITTQAQATTIISNTLRNNGHTGGCWHSMIESLADEVGTDTECRRLRDAHHVVATLYPTGRAKLTPIRATR